MKSVRADIFGNLYVDVDGYEYRRIGDAWEMKGNTGAWFECAIADQLVQRMVQDYESCLRSYGPNEGPAYPTGRRSGETVAAFIRRKQVEELRKGGKNIFAPVATTYDHMAETRRRLATRSKDQGASPRVGDPSELRRAPWHLAERALYDQAMQAKRGA